jgi:hypothetical protein
MNTSPRWPRAGGPFPTLDVQHMSERLQPLYEHPQTTNQQRTRLLSEFDKFWIAWHSAAIAAGPSLVAIKRQLEAEIACAGGPADDI